MYNYMVNQHQNSKLHIQPQAVPNPFQGITLVFIKTIYDQDQTMYNYIVAKLQIQYMVNTLHDRNLLHLNKVTYQNILVSADLDSDIYPFQAIARVFSKPSNHDPHTSRLQTQTRFFTPLSCDLEPDITKPAYSKIVVSYDLGPDPSAGIDSVGVIYQGFCGPFLLNSSCHDFEKVDKVFVPSNHDPHTSRLQTQTRFFTPLSCDLEPDITKPTSGKIVVSDDLGPDLSAGLDSGGVIT